MAPGAMRMESKVVPFRWSRARLGESDTRPTSRARSGGTVGARPRLPSLEERPVVCRRASAPRAVRTSQRAQACRLSPEASNCFFLPSDAQARATPTRARTLAPSTYPQPAQASDHRYECVAPARGKSGPHNTGIVPMMPRRHAPRSSVARERRLARGAARDRIHCRRAGFPTAISTWPCVRMCRRRQRTLHATRTGCARHGLLRFRRPAPAATRSALRSPHKESS